MTRLTYAIVTTAAVSLIGVASIASFAPRLIWNASASTPVGFYTIGDVGALDVTDLVAVDAPEPLATFLSDGGYLPRGVPLLKRVAAVPGQRVCRTGLAITVDGVPMGDALDRDRRGQFGLKTQLVFLDRPTQRRLAERFKRANSRRADQQRVRPTKIARHRL